MIDLTQARIDEIRQLRAKGLPHRDLALAMTKRGFTISAVTVAAVLRGERKANIGPDGWPLPREKKRKGRK